MTEHHSVIVIGAGLSGLYTAWQLHQQQRDVFLLEACERTGGRILSAKIAKETDPAIDMGPAWIWPQLQPRLRRLVAELDLQLFKQFITGDMIYEWTAEREQYFNLRAALTESG